MNKSGIFFRRGDIVNETFSREINLIGLEGYNYLKNKNVIIFGIGGVGGYAAEALARCGIEKLTLVDNDTVSESNINRQIIALNSTIGRYKTDVMKERILDINPKAEVKCMNKFYTSDNWQDFELENYDYVVDAIDTISSKIDLVVRCNELNIKIISCMGAGNKMNPLLFKIDDIYKTSVCPLARVMRRELKKRNIKKLKVLYSTEEAKEPIVKSETRKQVPASIAFIPSTAGLIIASEVVKDILNEIK